MLHKHRFLNEYWKLSVLLAFSAIAADAPAQQPTWNVVVQNATSAPVVVQASTIAGPRVIRARPQVVPSTKSTLPITFPSNRIVVTIYNARIQTQILARGTFVAPLLGLKLAVQMTPLGPQITKLP